jgi:hypothetical protein
MHTDNSVHAPILVFPAKAGTHFSHVGVDGPDGIDVPE